MTVRRTSIYWRTMARKIRVVIAKPGLDGHDRGAKIIARALRDAGMEVIYTGLHQTPEQIVETAIQEDADAVGISILSGAHMLVPRILEGLRENGVEDVLVVVGGTIPREDVIALKEQGVAEIFTPGAPVSEIVDFLRANVPVGHDLGRARRRDRDRHGRPARGDERARPRARRVPPGNWRRTIPPGSSSSPGRVRRRSSPARHQVHAGPRRPRSTALGAARPRLREPPRDDAEADDRLDQRLRAGRRLRAGARVRPAARVLEREDRSARDRPRDHPRLGRFVRLARTTTLGFAKELIFTGRPVDAQKALEHGLVNAVYEPGELREKTLELCRGLDKSPLALAYAKEAVNVALQGPHRTNLEIEARLFAMLFSSEDQSEGMAAFAEKRPPEFRGAPRSSPRRCRRPPGGPLRSRARTSGGAARRPVRPRLRVHLALRLLLDAVVADRRGRVEAGVDVVLGSCSIRPVSTAFAAHTPA